MLGWLAAADAPPAEISGADRTAIQGVITAQMDAFQHDDGPAAFAFAAPDIKQMFGDASNFLAMVRQGYPPVYRPRSVTYGALTLVDGHPIQRVELIGPDGQPRLALYTMEHDPDGTWKIAACMLTESEAVGA